MGSGGDNQRVRRPRVPLLLVAATVVCLSGCAGNSAATATAPSPGQSVPTSAPPSAIPAARFVAITSADVSMPPIPAVELPATAPRRIVSLAKGVGETLAALGVAQFVVGRDETSDASELTGAELVTKAHSASAEKVLSLSPDLVIIDASTTPPEAVSQIRDAGVRVVEVPEAYALSDIAARTNAVAEAVGVPTPIADLVIAEAGGSEPVPSPAADAPTVMFLYVRGTSAIYLVGGKGSGADDLIHAAGGIDAGAAAGYEAYVPLTAEAVATLDPDVILVMGKGLESVGGVEGLAGLPGVAQTTAGREGRVIAVDDTLLLSFGPRTGRLVDALRDAITQAAG